MARNKRDDVTDEDWFEAEAWIKDNQLTIEVYWIEASDDKDASWRATAETKSKIKYGGRGKTARQAIMYATFLHRGTTIASNLGIKR